jgi:WG containing repeat
VPPRFEGVGHSSQNGLVSASLGGKSGFIDSSGKWIIEPRFSDAQEFGCPSNDSAIVRMGDREGVINRAGELLFLLPGSIHCTEGPLLRYIKPGLSKGGCILMDSLAPRAMW